jgi:phage terminase Nu1 subunit (DNA packaging protein)
MPQKYPVQAIAQMLKLTERRVQQLVKDGILPRPDQGNYDAINCIHAYIDYLRKLVAGGGELSLTDERTRLTKYQADLAERELKKSDGDLLDTRKAMKLWGEIIMVTKQRLLGLSSRLAPVVATTQSLPEIKERIDGAIYEVLNELSNPDLGRIARAEGNRRGNEAVQTASPIDRKPVGRRKQKTKSGK